MKTRTYTEITYTVSVSFEELFRLLDLSQAVQDRESGDLGRASVEVDYADRELEISWTEST